MKNDGTNQNSKKVMIRQASEPNVFEQNCVPLDVLFYMNSVFYKTFLVIQNMALFKRSKIGMPALVRIEDHIPYMPFLVFMKEILQQFKTFV